MCIYIYIYNSCLARQTRKEPKKKTPPKKDQTKNLDFVLNQIKGKINIINLYNELENIRNEDPKLFSSFFLKNNYHFSSLGNDFVAKSIYEKIKNNSQN